MTTESRVARRAATGPFVEVETGYGDSPSPGFARRGGLPEADETFAGTAVDLPAARRSMAPEVPETPEDEVTTSDADAEAEQGETGGHAVPPKKPKLRLVSLDVVRGLLVIFLLLVDSWLEPPDWFVHSPWEGIQVTDYVFPSFMVVAGAGLALASRGGVKPFRLLRRVVILVAVGIAFNAAMDTIDGIPFAWATVRLPGVLQLFAIASLVVTLLHFAFKNWGAWALVTLLFAATYGLYLWGFTMGCPDAVLNTECNPSAVWDARIFTEPHMIYGSSLGYDPEGVPSLIGALASTSMGAVVGHLMLAARREWRERAVPLTGWRAWPGWRLAGVFAQRRVFPLVVGLGLAAGYYALGQLASEVIPPIKRIWTPTFALMSGAPVMAVMVVLHVLLDRDRIGIVQKMWTWPLVALGRNALLLYFGFELFSNWLRRAPWPGEDATMAQHIASWLPVPEYLNFMLPMLGLWLVLASVLHLLKWYVRA